jgi:tRNA A37 methylthiotransferase MiaB
MTFTHLQTHNIVEPMEHVEPSVRPIKILFYHAGGMVQSWVYPAALQLKTYIDILYKDTARHVQWLIPVQQETNTEELVTHMLQNNVDVLCTSHYLWNNESLMQQIAEIKALAPKITVIAGGPSIDVNNNKNFFEQYPYIDYAVYGAGEQAFADIINHLVFDKPMIAFNSSNCAWKHPVSGSPVVADYKFVKMLNVSPFVHNEKMFEAMVRDAKKQQLAVWLPYTLTRGCPYSCTFCDWNSGLGNKVSRRKDTYQQEIDLFQRVGLKNIYLSDANVGQYDEDVDMIEYFAQKNLQENANFHVGGNFSKLKKENNLKIFNIMARGRLVNKTLNFSVQDVNKQVLDNIDRPDVGWEVHVSMADELREKYPHLIVKAQLIYGLPGQTPATWRHTLDQVTQQNIFPIIFLNEPLPASPAIYNPEYQKKFQFEYIYSNRIISNVYSSKIPKKSSSFDQSDIVQMNLLSQIYIALSAINLGLKENMSQPLETSKLVDRFLNSQQYKNLHDNLYHNWTIENNFYYTINFSGKPVQSPDVGLWQSFIRDPEFIKFITQEVPVDRQRAFVKMAVNSKFQKLAMEIFSDMD